MRPRTALLLSALLLASGLSYYVSVHGSNVVEDGPVTLALAAELDNPKTRSVDFVKIAQFPFTEMQVFEPFTNRNDICRSVDLTGWECIQKVPFQVDANHYFVVFRQQTDVVHREFQSVSHGRYVAMGNGFKATDLKSKFTVARNFSSRDDNGKPLVYLAPQKQGLLAALPN